MLHQLNQFAVPLAFVRVDQLGHFCQCFVHYALELADHELEAAVVGQGGRQNVSCVDHLGEAGYFEAQFDEHCLEAVLLFFLTNNEVDVVIFRALDVRVSVVEVEGGFLFNQPPVVFAVVGFFFALFADVFEFKPERGRVAVGQKRPVLKIQRVGAQVEAEFVLLFEVAWVGILGKVKQHAIVVSVRERGVAREHPSVVFEVHLQDRVLLVVIVLLAVRLVENRLLDVEIVDELALLHRVHKQVHLVAGVPGLSSAADVLVGHATAQLAVAVPIAVHLVVFVLVSDGKPDRVPFELFEHFDRQRHDVVAVCVAAELTFLHVLGLEYVVQDGVLVPEIVVGERVVG
mmetsp:Transcript_22886/g.19154  ORF Transcript_22886/g.19154 Transcript_22886/m.19154 type:complete len:345 (-) Transcript_22886:2743-3777(-)